MNMENKELIEKTTSVLDKIMNYFKKVVNKQTITDKGTLHHAGPIDEGTEVYEDADMTQPAAPDTYTTSTGSKIAVKGGQVQKITPPLIDPDEDDEDTDVDDDDDDMPVSKLGSAVQNKIQSIKAKLHAQNALLGEARLALEAANLRLTKTREEVKNEIRSNFTPNGSKRSNKAKTEQQPFFAPTTAIAKNAVKKAISK
jgi:ATP-dependent Clp protease protease subunit